MGAYLGQIAGIALFTSALGLYGGYEIRDTMAEADLAKQLKAERKKFTELQQVNSDLVDANRLQKTRTKVEYKYITKKAKDAITKKQKSTNCNLSTNAVQLFNNFDPTADYAAK